MNNPVKSNLQKMGSGEWGAETGSHPLSTCVTPIGMPMSVVMMMLKKRAPFTLRAMSTPLNRMPMMPRMAGGVNLPKPTMVAGLATMISAFFSPMKAMNIPMPAEMA